MIEDFGIDGEVTPIQEPPKDTEPTPPNPDGIEPVSPEEEVDQNGNPITKIEKEEKEVEEPNGEEETPLQPGTELQLGDDTYTVDENGNVVDSEGNIFKEAKDVKEWLASFEQEEETPENELTIDNIKKALDITITDENDKEIEYENTPAGVKAYVEQVIENARQEHYETAIQTLYEKYPFIEDMLNYYEANGHSLQGYNEVPDRSNITINESDIAQQEHIIRTAWKEQNRKGDVNGYIEYLKSTGNLLNVAQEELEGLQESDKQYREQLKQQAEAQQAEQVEKMKQYWGSVHEIVKSRQIAGYNIPESIVVTRNGKKTTASPDDFFKYIYQVDDKGKSRYNYDVENEDPKARLHDDILRAYLKFTGGDYSNLVDMAINKKEVSKLILKSKENKKPSISIRKPAPTKKNNNIDLGFN